jgi:pimeloyl-ACP methyl ester carboxylesterase
VSDPHAFRVALPGRGVELAVYDWGGDGPLLLAAHANGFCGRLWQGVAEALEGRFRLIAYDARGHGDSSAPAPPAAYAWHELADDLLALTEQLCARLGLARIDYGVGNSMGGAMLLAAAGRQPQRFGRLCLVDPVVMPPDDPAGGPEENPVSERARRRRAVFASRAEVLASYRERPLFAGWQPRALELYAEHGFRERADGQIELKCAPEVEAAIFSQARGFDLFAQVAGLRVPGELMHAARGDFSYEVYERLCATAPGLELTSIDAAHLVPMVAPELLAERLIAFYER